VSFEAPEVLTVRQVHSVFEPVLNRYFKCYGPGHEQCFYSYETVMKLTEKSSKSRFGDYRAQPKGLPRSGLHGNLGGLRRAEAVRDPSR